MYRQRGKCGLGTCHWSSMSQPLTEGQKLNNGGQSSSNRLPALNVCNIRQPNLVKGDISQQIYY